MAGYMTTRAVPRLLVPRSVRKDANQPAALMLSGQDTVSICCIAAVLRIGKNVSCVLRPAWIELAKAGKIPAVRIRDSWPGYR